jgi:hypothetical protein
VRAMCHLFFSDLLTAYVVRYLGWAAMNRTIVPFKKKVIHCFNQRLQKISIDGTRRYHGTMPIIIKELVV